MLKANLPKYRERVGVDHKVDLKVEHELNLEQARAAMGELAAASSSE
jgi:hypothetical protein